jgi:hypothetical protein
VQQSGTTFFHGRKRCYRLESAVDENCLPRLSGKVDTMAVGSTLNFHHPSVNPKVRSKKRSGAVPSNIIKAPPGASNFDMRQRPFQFAGRMQDVGAITKS